MRSDPRCSGDPQLPSSNGQHLLFYPYMEANLAIKPRNPPSPNEPGPRSPDHDPHTADACVICLEPVSERAITSSCRHQHFDFLCLISWLHERPTCPLCNAPTTAVEYDLRSATDFKTYTLPAPTTPTSASTSPTARPNPHPTPSTASHPHRPIHHRPRRPYQPATSTSPSASPDADADAALARRRHIYRHGLYSLHVGANRLSRHQTLTPALFARDADLVSRARNWIRRELRVFAFLDPAETDTTNTPTPPPGHAPGHASAPAHAHAHAHAHSNGDGNSGGGGGGRGGSSSDRRANNAAFLLDYVIAILKTVDTQGSGGQAEEMLSEFLGREHTRLFLHELRAWLRSPYRVLADWDAHVQYGNGVRKWEREGERERESGVVEGGLNGRGDGSERVGASAGARARAGTGVAVRTSRARGSWCRREPYPDRRRERGGWGR